MSTTPQSPAPFITGPVLRQIFPELGPIRSADQADLISKVFPLFGMDRRDIAHEAIGTIGVESREMTAKEENLNYSAPRLREVFGKYFPTEMIAGKYAHKPREIANRVYANRMGNQGESSGDGWQYRGGGFIQITGFDMYQAYASYLKKPVVETRDLIRTSDYYALHSACWVFAVEKKLLDEALADDLVKIRKAVNGGLNGFADFKTYVGRAEKYFPA